MRLALLLFAATALAQQKPAAVKPAAVKPAAVKPAPVKPAAPKLLEPPQPFLAWIYPAGARQGTTVTVTLSGTGIQPEQVLISGAGAKGRVVEGGDGKTAKIAVEVAADAEPGVRQLRILNAGGVSNRFRFVIGSLPEMNETEPNSDKAASQRIPALPVVINGQILDGDRDYFRFHAVAGQTVVCQVEARSLLPFIADAVPGWFDPVVAIYDPSGKQLAFADDFRFHPDPIATVRAPAEGDYTLEIRDVIYRGRGDFIYRLKLGSPDEIRPDLAPIHLPPTDLPLVSKKEERQVVTVPVAIEGRITKAGESDYYRFRAEKGARLIFEVQARRYGSPLDSHLTLLNEKNVTLAENDDWTDPLSSFSPHQTDSRIAYTFGAAGEYTLRLRDVQGKGGDDYCYRLTIAPPKPDFALRITPDNPRMGQGDTAAITVNAVRRDDFTGEVQLSVEGLPKGFRASDAVIPAGLNEGRLTITSPPDAAPGILSPQILGTAPVGTHAAQPAEAMMQAFAYTHYVPTGQLYLAVTPTAAYTISADPQPIEVKPGAEATIAVRIHRMPGAQNVVTVLPQRLANGLILTKTAQVPADQDEVTITLTADKDAKPGTRQDLILSAVMRAGGQTITRYAPAIVVRIVQ